MVGKYIKLILSTDEARSESTIKAPDINDAMIQAARELIYTMMTGKRFKPKKPAKRKKR